MVWNNSTSLIAGGVFALSILSAAPAAAFEDPKVVKAVAPEYPRAAERRQIEGFVTLKLSVDERGKVALVEVVEAEPAGVFDKAATEAVEKWKFESGKPADGLMKRVAFKLVD